MLYDESKLGSIISQSNSDNFATQCNLALSDIHKFILDSVLNERFCKKIISVIAEPINTDETFFWVTLPFYLLIVFLLFLRSLVIMLSF